MPAACVQVRFLLIGVFGVVTEAKALAQEVCDFHTVGMGGVQRFRQVHRTLYRRTGSRSTKFSFLDLSSKRRPSVGSAFNTCNCLGIGGASGLAQPLCRLPMAVFCGDHVCKPYQHIFHTYRTDKRPVDNVCCGSFTSYRASASYFRSYPESRHSLAPQYLTKRAKPRHPADGSKHKGHLATALTVSITDGDRGDAGRRCSPPASLRRRKSC